MTCLGSSHCFPYCTRNIPTANSVSTTCYQDVFALLIPSLLTSCQQLVDWQLATTLLNSTGLLQIVQQLVIVLQFNNLIVNTLWVTTLLATWENDNLLQLVDKLSIQACCKNILLTSCDIFMCVVPIHNSWLFIFPGNLSLCTSGPQRCKSDSWSIGKLVAAKRIPVATWSHIKCISTFWSFDWSFILFSLHLMWLLSPTAELGCRQKRRVWTIRLERHSSCRTMHSFSKFIQLQCIYLYVPKLQLNVILVYLFKRLWIHKNI